MKLSKTFQYRNVWLGTAMLLIALFHSGFSFPSPILSTLKELAYFGVDICLFASGIGCYHSLEKDPNPLGFLKRRAKRLYPTYLCFIIPWLLYKVCTGPLPVSAIPGNLLGVQSLISWEYHFNWYISCLVVFYLLAPYLKQITDTAQSICSDLLVLLLLVLCSVPFWNQDHLIVLAARLPIFYLGMVYAKHALQGTELTANSRLLHFLAALAGGLALLLFFRWFPSRIWSHGLCWYPFLLIVPGLCMLLSRLAAIAEQYAGTRWINRLLGVIGNYSFEVYLVHDFLYETLMVTVSRELSMIPNNLLWVCTIPVVVIGCFLLNRIAKLLLSFLSGLAAKCGSR